MAKEKKQKRCKECEGKGKDCKCPDKAKKGFYGLERYYGDDDNHQSPISQDEGGSAEGGMSEAIKMPRAPQDSDKGMMGASKEKKQRKMSEFKKAADEAKKRQADKDRSDALYSERRTKGIKFYDAKGSGYIKGGKKHYD